MMNRELGWLPAFAEKESETLLQDKEKADLREHPRGAVLQKEALRDKIIQE